MIFILLHSSITKSFLLNVFLNFFNNSNLLIGLDDMCTIDPNLKFDKLEIIILESSKEVNPEKINFFYNLLFHHSVS